MKQTLILTASILFLAATCLAQGNWEVTDQTVLPGNVVNASGTVTASGSYTWTGNAPFVNDNHLATLSYAMPPSLENATGTPSLTYASNNLPVQGVTFSMNTGGWIATFAPGTVIAPGTKLVFTVSGMAVKNYPAYNNQQLTHFISFVSGPDYEDYNDNAGTTIFSTIVAGPLPISILNFTAQLQETAQSAQVNLDWTTSSEDNGDYFIAERSQNARDWEEVVRVKAKGNSSVEVKYHDVDKNPLFGLTYYRLKAVDMDGNYSYSAIRTVNRGNAQGSLVSVFPNPTEDMINVQMSVEDKTLVEVKLFSIEGKVVQSVMAWCDKGLNTLQLNMSELANGTYEMNVYQNNNLFETTKVLKK